MSTPVIHNPLIPPTSPVFGSEKTTHTQQQISQYHGQSITLLATPQSLAAQSLEEAGFFFQEKDLKQRKVATDLPPQDQRTQKVKESDSLEELGMAASKHKRVPKKAFETTRPLLKGGADREISDSPLKLLKKVPDINPDQLRSKVSKLLADKKLSPEAIVNKILAEFKDVTHKYIALRYAKEQVEKEFNSLARNSLAPTSQMNLLTKLNSLLIDQINEMLDNHRAQIKAGLNVSQVAAAFAVSMAVPIDELRKFYRDCVLNYGGLGQTYKKLIKRFKLQKFKKIKRFLEQSLAAELESSGASIQKEQLAAIIKDLTHLQTLAYLHIEMDEVYKRLKKKYFLNKPREVTVIESVLEIVEQDSTPAALSSRVDAMLRKIGISHIGAKVGFITGLSGAIKKISISVFKNNFQRSKVVRGLQLALDKAVSDEVDQSGDKGTKA